jgi:hypothetical protein
MAEPADADVYFKDYRDVDGTWTRLGRTPIKDARVPIGQLRWRIVKNGFEAFEGSSPIGPIITLHRPGEAPAGLEARGNRIVNRMWTLLHTPAVTLPSHTGPHGLPVGVQVIGPRGMDDRLLAMAAWMHARLV